jgi:hypothetical protein
MNVQEIVKAYLVANGYEGLYNDDAGCGCALDGLAPCDEMSGACRAGYKVPCQCGEGCDFDIAETKPVPPPCEKCGGSGLLSGEGKCRVVCDCRKEGA